MLKSLFLLDPDVVYLNHGSFGACPKPVIESYQRWQLRLEQQPVLFLGRQLPALLEKARSTLAQYIGAGSDEVVYIPNATFGVNIIAHSLDLKAGDEILTSDHEYGACDNAWKFICQKSGARYVRQSLPLPISSETAFVERLWQGVTERTRLIFLSHITSPTAQLFPVEAICSRARQAGILTLIDGAHAPGQLSVDLHRIGADFYTGNAHKWMLSPKGTAFLYARKEIAELVEPLVVSWGYSADESTTTGSRFIDLLQWSGTYDPSGALSVPTALEFMAENNWGNVRQRCNLLLRQALARLSELTDVPQAYSTDATTFQDPLPPQMAIAPIPRLRNPAELKSRLYDEFRIEIPVIEWNNQHFLRISVQGYNSLSDLDALLAALKTLLPSMKS